MKRILIIGGGAAGMMAAIAAAENHNQVILLEQNEKLGKKLFITGKGRCNLTNACEMEELIANIVTNHKFLYSSLYGCDNQAVMRFFETLGVPLKTERGNRVFPVSDHASDIIRALERELHRRKVEIRLRTRVSGLCIGQKKITGVYLADNTRLEADAVVVATGGLSYPSTGSTGDGYRFAREAGHTIVGCRPSLVPMVTKEPWCKDLMGLTLKNVTFTLYNGKKILFHGFGELLFTHFGISGPLVLSASAYLGTGSETGYEARLDLKPALTTEQLDERLQRDFFRYQNRQLCNAMDDLLPKKMIPVVIAESGIPSAKKVNGLTRQERLTLVQTLKSLPLHIIGTRDYPEAIVTAGGIHVKEIHPQTMESKLVKGLYFAGEVLDTDALTGGFNLQIAWSTGYAAGCGTALHD